jgi:hypothetical protein
VVIDIADGFVVLQSYIDSINILPEDRRWPFFLELFKYRMDGTEPEPQSDLERMALVNIFPVIDKSVERYTANKENGAKGGRPRKWIPPEEWKVYRETHSQKETADHFGIHVDTLRKWEKAEKPKNQDIDIDKDKDIDIDTDKDIYINIKEKNKKESESPKPLEGGSVPRPGQPGFAFVHNGKPYIINKDGKVAEVGTA